MKYIAHVFNGQIYVVEAPTMAGVYVGSGSQVFATLADVQAAWPGIPFAPKDGVP